MGRSTQPALQREYLIEEGGRDIARVMTTFTKVGRLSLTLHASVRGDGFDQFEPVFRRSLESLRFSQAKAGAGAEDVPAKLQALEAAHKAGILSDEEYARKKAELEAQLRPAAAQPDEATKEKLKALEAARQAGVLSEAEYERKKAELLQAATPQLDEATKEKLKALEAARQAGVLSEAEYARKKAELLGRQRTAVTSLALAAAVMVGINPQILWDASFQLSFMAMAGLIFIAPPLMNLGQRAVRATIGEEGILVSTANITADTFSVTLAATIAVWPLIAYYFGIVSLVGPLATFLALPALPAIIIIGALAGFVGLAFLPLAKVIGWLAWLFTSYMLMIVGGLAALPASSIEVGSVNAALIAVYYAALAIIVWLVSRKGTGEGVSRAKVWLKSGADKASDLVARIPKKWVIPPLLVMAVLASLAAAAVPDDELHISFLNIGQGDAILIQRGNQQVLIDGGPSPQALIMELGERMPFWDRTIELVILTHPHSDHLTGLVEVLERYQVEQVLYADVDDSSPLYQEWLELIEENDIEYTLAQAGQQIDLGDGVIIEVLHPPEPLLAGTGSDINNNSVVLRLSLGQVSFLLAADIEQEAEFELIALPANLNSTVLKVAHSGSYTSTTAEFLAAANPQVAVISVGENPFGHPSGEVLARLEDELGAENVYLTSEQGTIEFITDGRRLWVTVEN